MPSATVADLTASVISSSCLPGDRGSVVGVVDSTPGRPKVSTTSTRHGMPSRVQISSWFLGLSRARWRRRRDAALMRRWLPAVWLSLRRVTADLTPPAVRIPSWQAVSFLIIETSLAEALIICSGVRESSSTWREKAVGDSVTSVFALLMAVGLGIPADSGVRMLDARGSVLTANSGHNQVERRIAGHEEQRREGTVCRRA